MGRAKGPEKSHTRRLEQWLWNPSRDQRRLWIFARFVLTVARGSIVDRIWLRAGNMTYLSLLHLVPLGALALALSRGLGWQETLTLWIERRLSPTAPELAGNLVEAMNRLDIVAIGYVGLAAIILASVVALSELEVDLGEIWDTPHQRRWGRRIWLYPLAIVLAPTLLTGVLLLGALAEAQTTELIDHIARWGAVGAWLHEWLTRVPLVFELVPYILTWAVFTALYRFATPAPVHWPAAALGGLFTGIVWQIAQGAYIGFQFGGATYREIWGYLAQIPLLLIWIYISWIIVFVGAEVVYAWQNRAAFMPKWRPLEALTFSDLVYVAARIAADVLNATRKFGEPTTLTSVSRAVRLPLTIIREWASNLQSVGLIRIEGENLIPSPDLAETSIGEISSRLRTQGESQLPRQGRVERPEPLTSEITIGQVVEIESGKQGSSPAPN